MRDVCQCSKCQYAVHENFKGHSGRWICTHPHRDELDNKGEFTFPKIEKPMVVICETPSEDYGNYEAHREALRQAKIPRWCYYWAVKREKARDPLFDEKRQRALLYNESKKQRYRPYFFSENSIEYQQRFFGRREDDEEEK